MPAAPIPQALQPTPTLQETAQIQDPAQRGAALRQRMLEEATPIAHSAQAAVPTVGVSEALPNTGKLLPSTTEAGKAFETLDDAIGDNVIDVSKVGDVALKAQDWWNSGGQRIKQISDFLKRATQPDADPITFSEARLFLQNAGPRLSAQESQNLPPMGRKYLAPVCRLARQRHPLNCR